MARDSRNVTAVCDEPSEITGDQRDHARLTVCRFAEDASEAEDLMMMLGIHPRQKPEDDLSIPASILGAVPQAFT
jgi:hypothetical protein